MNYKIIKRCVNIAISMSPLNRDMRCSHIAFLIEKGKIIHIGFNKYKTHPRNLEHPYHDGFVGLHAELDCILKSGMEELNNVEMLVLRIDRNNTLTMSKPCVGCQSVIKQFNIKNCYYSDFQGVVNKL